jgi:hypothetical protein
VNSETWDVFQHEDSGSNFIDHPEEIVAKPSFVCESSTLAGQTEWLTRDTPSDARNAITPRLAVEGAEIVPDRSLIQGLLAHPRHEICRRITFPLNVTDGAKSGPEDSESEFKSANSGTYSQAIHESLQAVALRPVTLHVLVPSRVTWPRRSNSGSLFHAPSMLRRLASSLPVIEAFDPRRKERISCCWAPNLPLFLCSMMDSADVPRRNNSS